MIRIHNKLTLFEILHILLICTFSTFLLMDYTSILKNINPLLYRVLLVLLLIEGSVYIWKKKSVNKKVFLFSACMFFSLSGTFLTQISTKSFSFFTPYILASVFLFIFIINKEINQKCFEYILKYNLFIITIFSLFGLILFLITKTIVVNDKAIIPVIYDRLTGIYGNANHAALVNGIAILISTYFININIRKWAYWLMLIINALFISKTDSRSAVVALMIVLIYLSYRYINGFKKWNVILIPFVSIAIVISLFFVLQNIMNISQKYFTEIYYTTNRSNKNNKANELSSVYNNYPKVQLTNYALEETAENISTVYNPINVENILLDRGSNGDVSSGRFEIWNDAFEIILEKPFFGMSHLDIQARMASNPYNTVAGNLAKIQMQTHNSYLYVVLTTGICGAIIYFTFLVSISYKFYFSRIISKNNIILLGIVLYIFVEAFFLTTGFHQIDYGTLMIYSVLGYLCRYDDFKSDIDILRIKSFFNRKKVLHTNNSK